MEVPPSYLASVTGIARRLRDDPSTYLHLNRAAGEIDQLGRRLHGLGCVRHREIAACLMAAVAELQAAIELPEPARSGAVARAVGQLEAAVVNIGEGTTT